MNTASCVSMSIRRRVRDTVEWSGEVSCSATSRNCRRLSESAARHGGKDAGLGSAQTNCKCTSTGNVIGHLPERLHGYVGKALRDAWDLDSASRAARALERLAGSLERDHPGAAASIREGLDETLTVQRLGLTGALQRTLRTTNLIENLNGSVERYARNVRRWRGGQMIQRWVASALVGGGEALPAGPGLPRSTALGLRVGRTGPARLLGG